MAKARFVYTGKDRTVESLVRKSKNAGGLYDSYLVGDVSMLKVKEGESCIRVLPPTWKDKKKYGDEWDIGVYLHFSVGPDNAAYLCLDKMRGESCPVCEAQRSAADETEADKLKPSFRVLAWVIDRDNEKAGPQVWSLPPTLFKEITLRSIDKKSNAPILIDDPEEGYDIVFNRVGTTLNTKYTAVEVSRDPSPLHDNQAKQDTWLEYITEHPLPDLLNFYDAEHIEKVLFGRVQRPAREAPEETDETSARTARRRKDPDDADAEPETPRRGSRRAEPEPEPEEEAPSRSSRRRALLDEETDPEPEPETPRRGSRRAEPEPEPEDEAPPARRRAAPEDDAPVATARRSLERLKPRGR